MYYTNPRYSTNICFSAEKFHNVELVFTLQYCEFQHVLNPGEHQGNIQFQTIREGHYAQHVQLQTFEKTILCPSEVRNHHNEH